MSFWRQPDELVFGGPEDAAEPVGGAGGRLRLRGWQWLLIACLSVAGAFLYIGSARQASPVPNRSFAELTADLGRSGDARVRAAAARRLAAMKDRGVEPLIAALRDPAEAVRLAAIAALGDLRDARAVEPLCDVLGDHDQPRGIRLAAARALGRLQDARAIEPLIKAFPYAGMEVSAALVGLGEPAVPRLIAALSESETRTYAAEVLATIGSAAVPALIETFHRGDNRFVRLAAARALAESLDTRAVDALDEALKTGDDELMVAVYRHLVRKGRPGSESLLIRLLDTYGRLAMAEDFAASGNSVLKSAAEAWAWKMRQPLATSREESGLRWGVRQAPATQLGLFHYDRSMASTSGAGPTKSSGISFLPGKWGSAAAVDSGGILSYPSAGNLDFRNGTIEMWISPRLDGTNPIYAKYNHALLLSHTPKGDQFLVSESTSRGFYAGSVIRGEFRGAGGGDISSWRAGEWHHVAFTYSSGHNRQRFYIDGALAMERHGVMPVPGAGADSFTVGSDPYGNWSAFAVDELRISSDEKTPDAILYHAGRKTPFADHEVFRSRIGSF